MNLNYTTLAIAGVLILLLIAFLIFRNKKDQKNFEKESNESEIKPDKHDDPKI
ncbi:LPXTG cell wall anchor domain-containing protein [Pedobacter metabolipauper]|uniref:LPXTG-motif cell wall-anchored protein n=1 Tax=Pedobacter metabolipauper TaxID=425513 RepID=A0A4R6SQG0_9SPHI|nr:LPXTG cell wall anchor domain-containing protein [Pedobacter metabolipauper]TDQ06981.1 LPXTG-motif cell wall-anchored protein [Pedobacter metabolipauper]